MPADHPFRTRERDALAARYDAADRIAVGFAMDYPDGLVSGMHRHPRAQLIYAIAGVMRVETERSLFVLPPTKALLLPTGVLHSISMEGRVAMRELFLHPDAARGIAGDTRVMAVGPLLRELLVAVCDEPVDWAPGGRAQHLVALIIDEIARARTLPTELPLPRDARLLRVARAVCDRPADPRGLDDWATVAGASRRTLARLFLRETGMTFGQWRLQARLNAAFVLLMTDGNIARVARDVGFRSQSAFGAAFVRAFGITPGQARLLRS
jgi:AraC-like DNA-binding protein